MLLLFQRFMNQNSILSGFMLKVNKSLYMTTQKHLIYTHEPGIGTYELWFYVLFHCLKYLQVEKYNLNTELIMMKRSTTNLPTVLVFSYINPSKKEVYV